MAIIKSVFVGIIFLILTYSFTSFIFLTTDYVEWGIEGRLYASIIGGVLSLFSGCVAFDFFYYDDEVDGTENKVNP